MLNNMCHIDHMLHINILEKDPLSHFISQKDKLLQINPIFSVKYFEEARKLTITQNLSFIISNSIPKTDWLTGNVTAMYSILNDVSVYYRNY